MYSYLITDGGLLPVSLNHKKSYLNQTGPPCTAGKFKLAVFTVPAKSLACAMTCYPCQPTKFKGYKGYSYMWVIHYFHALEPFRTTGGRLRIGEYTIGEVPSLK